MKPILNFMLFVFFNFFNFNLINALPQVRVQPATAILPSSSEARLLCESKDTPFLSVAYWTHVGQRIQLNPSIIEMDGNELHIYQFGDTAYTQPGAYACVVTTEYGLLESEPAMLSLPTLDSFKTTRRDNQYINITEGNIAVIQCELPNGNPRPLSYFVHNDQPLLIENDSHRYRISPHGHLHIFDVKQSDAGIYQCYARNPLTGQTVNNSQTTTLHILNKPSNVRERPPLTTVYKPPVASRVLAGNNFSIDCIIAGWPKPTVEWEKYGDVLPDKRHEVRYGTLYLYDVRLDDRGTYICRASNFNGQSDIAYTALLEVLEPPKVLQRPDSVIQLARGESLSIKCAFRGRPEPVINWLYNGEEILSNGSPIQGGVLSLSQPKSGIYQCIGRNPYGVAHASTVLMLPNSKKVEDTVESDLPLKRSLIVIGPNNITVYEGETIQLHCLTQPGSSIQWLHNGDVINLNMMRRYEMLASGGLRIVSAQRSDSGIYECLASKIGFGTSTAKCVVQIQGLEINVPEKSTQEASIVTRSGNKLEIINIQQVNNQAVELFWKSDDSSDTQIQIQYRLPHGKVPWITDPRIHNHSTTNAIVSELKSDETYRFRLLSFDSSGQHTMTSPMKRFTLQLMNNLPIPQITDAWITPEGQVTLKWKLNETNVDHISGFIIYYRSMSAKHNNFTKITIPHTRYPLIDTYTISNTESSTKYELRMATYTEDDTSTMSNAIEISIPSLSNHRRPPFQQKSNLNNLDEVLENITKMQNPSRELQDDSRIAATINTAPTQKSSDILYLTIGIIAGILLILIIILIVMCLLRILQRKKFIAHVKSVNGSEYYCDGMHKTMNPDYATTPCLQHGVVSVDGKLIPFAYPTNSKQPLLWHGKGLLPHSSTTMTTAENGTLRVNTNPMNQHDVENNGENQENFYHTLTPFTNQSQYGEHEPRPCGFSQPAMFAYPSDRMNMSSCPVHHHLVNYAADTFSMKMNVHSKDNTLHKNLHGTMIASQNHVVPCAHFHHHGTCQRHPKSKRMTTPVVHENDQQNESCDRSYSSSSASAGHYCTHSSNESTRPLMSALPSQAADDHLNENFKHTAPPSTGSSSHSSSGISSSMESPYNHWKYLTPLSVNTNETAQLMSDTQSISPKDRSPKNTIEPVQITST